jgi:hypothetical protein
VKEVRCLLFREVEVLRALMRSEKEIAKCRDHASTISISYQHEGEVSAIVQTNTESIAIDHTQLLTALLVHCQKNRVPLPAAADKTMHIIRGHLALVVALNMNKAPRLIVSAPRPR